MIIWITGIIGSGKSYLGDKLEHDSNGLIKHYDIDKLYIDIVKKSTAEIDKRILEGDEKGAENLIVSRYYQYKDKLIAENRSKYQALIFSSQLSGFLVPSDKVYFIELKDIEENFRNTLRREINRIVTNRRQIEKIISTQKNPNAINFYLREVSNILLCFWQIESLNNYRKAYEAARNDAVLMNVDTMTQDQIYQNIMGLISRAPRRKKKKERTNTRKVAKRKPAKRVVRKRTIITRSKARTQSKRK
jgi:adenylate kinase family enzyme